MAGHSVRKRCRDCRKVAQGTPGRVEWCDCGGELVPLPYGPRRRKAANGGRSSGR